MKKKGVCWHYCKLVKILLEDAGIMCDTVSVTVEDECHMILKTFVEGKWLYIDPTMYTSDSEEYIMDEAAYQYLYQPNKYMHFNW